MADKSIVNRANMIAIGLGTVLGHAPRVVEYPDYVELQWEEDQVRALSERFNTIMSKEPTGDIRVKAAPIFYPYITQKAVPWLLGAAGAGYLVGRL